MVTLTIDKSEGANMLIRVLQSQDFRILSFFKDRLFDKALFLDSSPFYSLPSNHHLFESRSTD